MKLRYRCNCFRIPCDTVLQEMSDESQCERTNGHEHVGWWKATHGESREGHRSDFTIRWSKALAHCVVIMREFLNEVFRYNWIGLGSHHVPASLEWPPCSPDVSHCDYAMWCLWDRRLPRSEELKKSPLETLSLPLLSSAASVLAPHLEANNSISQKWVVHMVSLWRKWGPEVVAFNARIAHMYRY
jgi:hypothetical protein